MGFLSRRRDPNRDLARAIAKRGVRTRGTIDSIQRDGTEVTVRLRFTAQGVAREQTVTVRQTMAPQAQVGLEPGEPVEISYDADAPETVLIWGSPKYRVTETGAVVRAVDVEGGETSIP